MRRIDQAGHLRFHCVGDTGGIHDRGPQSRVAAAMACGLQGDDPARFLYHLGDIVYQYGEEAHYHAQFVKPYADYAAPIFAIPGNHDGDPAPATGAASLQAFVKHFCASPVLADNHARLERALLSQPHVHWTLEHRWITIIGLYTNVPEGGSIADDQQRWLTAELKAAPRGRTVILAMHHPVYSIDSVHGSNLALGAQLDECFRQAGRAPDAVLAAHAHNYQRFTRTYENRSIPYLIAGTGGYPDLHEVAVGAPATPASFDGLADVVLENYQDGCHGFITVTVGPGRLRITYNVLVNGAARPFDAVSITPVM